MTNEQMKRWRGIVARCERFAPITINSKQRFEALLAIDEELRRLRRQVAQDRLRLAELEQKENGR